MVPVLDRELLQNASSRPVNWRGRSGRFYALSSESIDRFALEGDELYLIALGHNVLWAGSSREVVNDAESRARFRLALTCADRVFHVDSTGDEVERMTIVWDLEGGEPVLGLALA